MALSFNRSKLKLFRKCCIFSPLQLQILVTFGLCILIWLIQLLHYPSFTFYEESHFPQAMLFHQRRISFIVIPLMFFELFLTGRSFYQAQNVYTTTCLIMLIGIWLSTFSLQVPAHEKLILKKDDQQIKKLVKTNWIRTILWSLKLVVLLKQAYL